jgi:hypothetical protein
MKRVRKTTSYQVVFQREGHDIETLYWTGSLHEVRELSREIAFKCGADIFQITKLTGRKKDGWSERAPFSSLTRARLKRP